MARSSRAAELLLVLFAMAGCGAPTTSTPDESTPAVSASPSPSTSPAASSPAGPTATETRLLEALVAFAESRDPGDLAAVPFADSTWLGLADDLLVTRTAEDLRQPEAWRLGGASFRGYVGPFSALDLLARGDDLAATVGPHPHCASPPVPPPADVAGLRRLSVQPTEIDACLRWWTVDLFLAGDGRIEAITLDLWEP